MSEDVVDVEKVLDVARKVIIALIDARDFLGYQLSHAKGMIPDDEMAKITRLYTANLRVPKDPQQVAADLAVIEGLMETKGFSLDVDLVATMFRCTADVAIEAIEHHKRRVAEQKP